MNNIEINLKIAELKGYKIVTNEFQLEEGTIVIIKEDGYPHRADYINDPVQREPLMITLGKAGWKYCYDPLDKKHQWFKRFIPQLAPIQKPDGAIKDKHFGKAICLAWLELKTNE